MENTNTRTGSIGQLVICTIALSLSYAIVLSLSDSLSRIAGASVAVQTAASAIAGAAFIALAVLSTWRPALVGPKMLTGICTTLIIVGIVGITAGYTGEIPALAAFGFCSISVGGSCTTLLVKASFVSLGTKEIAACIVASFLLGHGWSFVFSTLGPVATMVVHFVITLGILIATNPYYAPLLRHLQASETPNDLAAVRPSAFVAFGHQLFIYLALFNFSHGYLLAFAPSHLASFDSLFPLGTIAVIGVVLIMRKGRMFPDALFSVAVLFIVGGFLLVPIAEIGGTAAASWLSSGVVCFNILYLYTLLAISSRNKINAIPVLAWGASIETFSMLVGSLAGGAILDRFAADHTAISLLSIAIVLIILGSILFTIRSFSFSRTIESVEPETSLSLATQSSTWEERAAHIGKQAALTPREQEVFALLARGRNSPFIQKELFITNNTVKAHVKHIYQKLGVSSHQELIDLVDGEKR